VMEGNAGVFVRKKRSWSEDYAIASGAGVGAGGEGVSGTSGVGVSSTPWPLQSGQELRPVVSHYDSQSVHRLPSSG
jgi:hypothetical protein